MNADSLQFQSAGWLSLTSFALAAGVNQILTLIDRLKGRPAAAQLESSQQHLASRCDRLEDGLKSLQAAVKRDGEAAASENDARHQADCLRLDSLRLEWKSDIAALRDKVNGVASQVTGLETASSLLSQRLVQMDQKLDRFIERHSH